MILQDTGDDRGLSFVPLSKDTSRSAPPSINLRQLFNASLELHTRKQKENITPKTPSDDGSDFSSNSMGSGPTRPPLRIAPRRVQTPTPRIPLPSYQFSGGNQVHYGVEIRQKGEQEAPVQGAAQGVLQAEKPAPAKKAKKTTAPTTRKLKSLSSTEKDTPDTASSGSQDEQPYCCIKGCRKPVHNRLRHSLKVYTVEDCDPDFVARHWERVCAFHYFRDNYLFRKKTKSAKATNGKRKRSEDDEGPALKKRAGNHDEAQ